MATRESRHFFLAFAWSFRKKCLSLQAKDCNKNMNGMGNNRFIRFDWAAKYMLRNKADFAIFEGLISVLVGEKVTIVELLESESNQEYKDDKYNRVDIKAKDSHGQIILVEIQ